MSRKLVTVFLATTLGIAALGVPAKAQLAVFDGSNLTQNILQAARALQQINNQLQQLRNEATMLQDMGKNLTALNTSQLSPMISALNQESTLLNQGNSIAFNVTATNNAFASWYPGTYPVGISSASLESSGQSRWQQAMSAFRKALEIEAQVSQNVQADAATLSSLVNISQRSVGNLEAVQATNQLLALTTKQQLQSESLMAAEYRANSLDEARKAEDETAAHSEFTAFLGNPTAYTPQ